MLVLYITKYHYHRLLLYIIILTNHLRIFSVNIKAVINVTQTVVEDLMQRNKPGSIVNISSQVKLYLL